MRISDWSSDVCSSDLAGQRRSALGEWNVVGEQRVGFVENLHVEAAIFAPHRMNLFGQLQLELQVDRRIVHEIDVEADRILVRGQQVGLLDAQPVQHGDYARDLLAGNRKKL